ncbi:hypothetical protein [Pseudoteredinibacter isoporae]|uniref:hypothetical protein n=1 Tax=Pseudoteredinibacter isoporae TaxID=570281 RepID=UPI0031021698
MYKDCSHSNILLKLNFGLLCLSFLLAGACTASESSLEINGPKNQVGEQIISNPHAASSQLDENAKKAQNRSLSVRRDETPQDTTAGTKKVEVQSTFAPIVPKSVLIPENQHIGKAPEASSNSAPSKVNVSKNQVEGISVDISVPNEAFNIKLIEANKSWLTTNWLSLVAILVSVGGIFYNIYRDRASSAASKKDGFWFREMISPKYMVPMLALLNKYHGKYAELVLSSIPVADEDPSDESAEDKFIEFIENWDSELDKVNQSSFYLKVMASGEEAKVEIKNVHQKLLQTITNRFFEGGLATIPGEEPPELYSNPFIDASADLIDIFSNLQINH